MDATCEFIISEVKNRSMGNLLPLAAVALAGPAIIALVFYRRGA
ncbi:photosystem II reaction center protein Ycf12/Psb30 [Prochlorococcus marinus]|nr:photosystem II reaction center protein Ycf12 [Prochlorococcus marinus]